MDNNLIIRNEVIIDGADLSANFTSLVQDISSTRSFSLQGVWTGATSASSADVISIGASLDLHGTFTTIATTTLEATSGSFFLNVEFPSYPFIKVSYVRATAAAGTITIKIAEKI